MRKQLITIGFILTIFLSTAAQARDVIITNQLKGHWLVVQQLYMFGISSTMSSNSIVIAPNSKQSWVIRIPALDNYFYGVKIYATDTPDDLSNAILICKSQTDKSSASWFPYDLAHYDCDEDVAVSEHPDFDPENEPYTVMVTGVNEDE